MNMKCSFRKFDEYMRERYVPRFSSDGIFEEPPKGPQTIDDREDFRKRRGQYKEQQDEYLPAWKWITGRYPELETDWDTATIEFGGKHSKFDKNGVDAIIQINEDEFKLQITSAVNWNSSKNIADKMRKQEEEYEETGTITVNPHNVEYGGPRKKIRKAAERVAETIKKKKNKLDKADILIVYFDDAMWVYYPDQFEEALNNNIDLHGYPEHIELWVTGNSGSKKIK